MKVLTSDNVAMCDVDDTLVTTDYTPDQFHDTITVTCGNNYIRVLPIQKHINLLQNFKGRNFTNIIWSQGGWEWAEAVVKALELEPYVDLIICKPKWYIDDLPCQEFMGKRTFLLDEKEEV